MAAHLSNRQVEAILDLIDSWPAGTKLTWDALLRRIEARLGVRRTRQALCKHDRIARAVRIRKGQLRDTPMVSERCVIPNVGVQRLRSENARLQAEVQALLEERERWEYNAYTHGVTRRQLDAPRLPVDRDRTDPDGTGGKPRR